MRKNRERQRESRRVWVTCCMTVLPHQSCNGSVHLQLNTLPHSPFHHIHTTCLKHTHIQTPIKHVRACCSRVNCSRTRAALSGVNVLSVGDLQHGLKTLALTGSLLPVILLPDKSYTSLALSPHLFSFMFRSSGPTNLHPKTLTRLGHRRTN